MYFYGLLRREVSEDANRHNDYWLGPETLGIEVTSPNLAARCGLGNIDPQHQAGGGSSAIEEAFHLWDPPKADSKLVTIRPDKDSFGAMAVLALKAQGKGHQIDRFLISWIGAQDRHGYKNALNLYPELAARFAKEDLETDALNTICLNQEPYPELADKVLHIGRILCREVSWEELARIAALRKERRSIAFKAEMHGDVAFILARGTGNEARSWANGHFRVAVILDYQHLSHGGVIRKWSVIRREGHFDRREFELAINRAEAGARKMSLEELQAADLCWGGNLNIVSSPQGRGRQSKLSKRTVLSIVRRCLESRIVS